MVGCSSYAGIIVCLWISQRSVHGISRHLFYWVIAETIQLEDGTLGQRKDLNLGQLDCVAQFLFSPHVTTRKKKRERAVTASSEEVIVILWVCSDDAPTASFVYLMKDLCLAPAEWPLLISAQKAASHTGQNPRFGRRTPELHHYLLALCLKLANNGGLTAKLLYMWLFRWRWWCCCGAQEQSGRVFA